MGVTDGQAVSAAVTNPAFIDADGDDFTIGKLGLRKVSGTAGFFVDDTQRYLNNIAQVIGLSYTANYTAEADATGRDYGVSGVWLPDGTTMKSAIGLIGNRFDGSSGHAHTGADGEGPPISVAAISDYRAGAVAMSSNTISIAFSTAFANTNYSFTGLVRNLLDTDPIFMQWIVTAKSASGVTLLFSAPVDSVNYAFEYMAGAFV